MMYTSKGVQESNEWSSVRSLKQPMLDPPRSAIPFWGSPCGCSLTSFQQPFRYYRNPLVSIPGLLLSSLMSPILCHLDSRLERVACSGYIFLEGSIQKSSVLAAGGPFWTVLKWLFGASGYRSVNIVLEGYFDWSSDQFFINFPKSSWHSLTSSCQFSDGPPSWFLRR